MRKPCLACGVHGVNTVNVSGPSKFEIKIQLHISDISEFNRSRTSICGIVVVLCGRCLCFVCD